MIAKKPTVVINYKKDRDPRPRRVVITYAWGAPHDGQRIAVEVADRDALGASSWRQDSHAKDAAEVLALALHEAPGELNTTGTIRIINLGNI